MINGEAPDPKSQEALTSGTVFTVAGGVLGAFGWLNSGASLSTLSGFATLPLAYFAAGVLFRVMGSLINRRSEKLLAVVVGNVVAFLMCIALWAVVANFNDQSQSVGLMLITGLAGGVPLVILLSSVSEWATRSAPLRLTFAVGALAIAPVVIAGAATTYWRA